MIAVQLACRSLLLGETNMAIAGAVNLLLHPFDKSEMPMVISQTGKCRTFDSNADGFARAEGCGVLVLKRLSDAIRDDDQIWALIRGSGVAQEGISQSMGTPTVHCETLAMSLALKDAKVKPSDVSYVEAHGTGTVIGDPMEISAIEKAYGCEKRREPLIIASVKTNVGHTESCSGITGIMKVALAMHNNVLPPHINFKSLNPSIDLKKIPARIILEPESWVKVNEKPRLAGVSSFGITGTDAHVVMEEPIENKNGNQLWKRISMSRPLHLLKVSAKSEDALEVLLERYQEHLESLGDQQFPDFVYTANAGRADFPHRAVLLARDSPECAKILQTGKYLKGEISESSTPENICFLFPGQSTQYEGMAKELYESSPVFRMYFDKCNAILRAKYGLDMKIAIWGPEAKELNRTLYSQTSIFCVQYALLKLWESWGIFPDYVMGHSLGEFCAAVAANILTLDEALTLVGERSILIDKLPQGKMLVVKADRVKVNNLMKTFAGKKQNKFLDYAALNSDQQTVVAGDSTVVQEFERFCSDMGIKTVILNSTHAFHSKHMDPMLEKYYAVAKTVQYSDPGETKPLYISGLRGTGITKESVDAEYWVDHTREKVEFLNASNAAVQQGCQIFIEIGPQPILSALTMMNNEGAKITCFPSLKKNDSEWNVILDSLGKLYMKGVEVDWKGVDQFYGRKKVRIPHYPFQRKRHWPNMMAHTGNVIHPLLGSAIPNASASKLFQNSISSSSIEFAKDHAIGNNVIFPGAGYLEMCLAAGHSTVEGFVDSWVKPTRPMKVENLTIEAPLRLEESKSCLLQTLVDFNNPEKTDWNNVNLKILHRLESELESVKWLPHVTATFSPLPSDKEKLVELNTENILNHTSKEHDEKLINEVYEKLSTLGLKFGPMFQSLTKIWNVEAENGILAEVKVPTDGHSSQQYIIHPVILDAMIQAIMLKTHKDKIKRKLHVPISIGSFVWLSCSEPDDLQFIYAFDRKPNPESGESTTTAILMTQEGKLLAIMSNVEFIDTTVKAVESVLEQQTCAMPDLWEESWRAKLGPMQYRIPTKILNDDSILHKDVFAYFNITTDEMNDTIVKLEKFAYYWIINAFYECGWSPEIQKRFTLESLLTDLKITKQHRLLLNYFLEVLGTEGNVRRLDCKDSWEVIRLPDAPENIKIAVKSSLYTEDLVMKFDTTRIMARVGEYLPDILQGKVSGLSILFPESDKNLPSVKTFYETYGEYFNSRDIIKELNRTRLKAWKERLNSEENPENKFVCRIIEVGAGTGFFTRQMLEALDEENIEFEYTYTDISQSFFNEAGKKFEKFEKSIKYKKLNIEEDTLLQGVTPEYYDLAIASDVIHATKDVVVTLKNLRKLLRPGGNINIYEQLEKNGIITFIFGIVDGFWRFQDDLRENHCTMPEKLWRVALEKSGFEKIQVFPTVQNRHGYLTASAKDTTECIKPSLKNVSIRLPTWIVFTCPETKLGTYLRNKLESQQRKVVEVISGQDTPSFSTREGTLKLMKNDKEDMKKLFEKIIAGSMNTSVEGVIYLWGLDKRRQEQSEILQPFLYLIQEVTQSLKQKIVPRIYVITEGVVPLGDNDLSHTPPSTLWGFMKVMKNEHTDMNCRCIGIKNEETLTENDLQELFCELWSEDKESQIAFMDNSRCIPRFQPLKPSLQDLSLPLGTARFQLVLPSTKSIADLQFGPLDPFSLEPEEIEIVIKVSALNFRDIFAVLKPTKYFENLNTVGFDFSGVVSRVGSEVSKWNVGDYVFGANLNGGPLPSHIKCHEGQVKLVPSSMTLADAATLPAVFCTSYVCLIEVAKIKPTDVILIHTASGGVGLCAIQLAQLVGATIIATAGNERKRKYLRNLGIRHIFNSRTTHFSKQILEVTEGKGVSVVLNSLTSEGFKEATLKACAKGARFVEMSKLNVWTPDEIHLLRPDVEYNIVDISKLDTDGYQNLINQMDKYLEENIVTPLPYTKFDGVNIREALRYLQGAKHIGKVLVVMPELRMQRGEVKVFTPQFNSNSSYLITGGLGGIGFEVANWMIDKGAKHILLAGRSAPSPTMLEKITKRNSSSGSNLISVKLDIGDFDQCKTLLERTIPDLNIPPLRGIMHAAGTLSDGLIINQTDWAKFSSTFNAKVNGTMNLHNLTRNYRLEHFVLFSSVASLFGSPAQPNHAAGNNFEDTFAHYRHSMGLPATSINWGQWGQVGIATEIDLPGMKALSTLQGLTALEYALKSQRVQMAVLNVESFVLCTKLFPQIAVYLDEKIWKTKATSGSSLNFRSDEFWQEYDTKATRDEKLSVVKGRLKGVLRYILKLDENDVIEDNTNFQEMGVDSLMFVEIKNALQSLLGDRITVTASALRDCNNVQLLADQLVILVEGEGGDNSSKPSNEEVVALLRQDTILPETINTAGIKSFCNTGDIKSVLVTGATGTLGPYILLELSKRPNITKIYCLIRPSIKKPDISNKDRLFRHLENMQLLSHIDTTKLECVEGNVIKENLGVQDALWNSLAENVDAIFHCAIRADHTQYYKKRISENDDQDVRTVNIQGLKNVLGFACEKKVKHIFHASSLLSVSTTDEDGRLSESWPNFEGYDEITSFAYPISKFVSEILLKEAVARGIPCKVFRFPIICGHSETGVSSAIQYNHLMLRYFYIMKCGMMPSNPFPMPLIPVDTCAHVSIKIFFDERACLSDIYNITHDKPALDQQFTTIAQKFGYHVDVVEFQEFIKKMESESDDSSYAMFKQMYKNDDELMATYTSVKAARTWMEGNENFWLSKKVQDLMPDYYTSLQDCMECLHRDLQFAQDQGYFETFGLNKAHDKC